MRIRNGKQAAEIPRHRRVEEEAIRAIEDGCLMNQLEVYRFENMFTKMTARCLCCFVGRRNRWCFLLGDFASSDRFNDDREADDGMHLLFGLDD